MRETSTDSVSVRRSVSLPLPARLLLLSVSLFLFLILNAVGVGAQTGDDHGNDLNNATNLPLGSSVAGRIDPGDDVDVFKLDLSGRVGATDVWIYTTGELDTAGGLYYSSGGQPFASNDDSFISGRPYNFHLRATLAPGIYYVEVFSFDGLTTGSYTLHAEAVVDPGNTIGTAKTLNLSAPTAGSIDFTGDRDYFRLDLATSTHLYLNVRSVRGERVVGYTVDVGDRVVPSNTYLRTDGFFVRDHFGPGTHYIRVFKLFRVGSNPVPYTIHAFEDADYPAFLEDCQAKTDALNDPQIGDSLYGCQWHLRNHSGEDINVEPVWAEGITGEGINIALVDDGMHFNHEDLRENVNTSLNRNYTKFIRQHLPSLPPPRHMDGGHHRSAGQRRRGARSCAKGLHLRTQLLGSAHDLQPSRRHDSQQARNSDIQQQLGASRWTWLKSGGSGLGTGLRVRDRNRLRRQRNLLYLCRRQRSSNRRQLKPQRVCKFLRRECRMRYERDRH